MKKVIPLLFLSLPFALTADPSLFDMPADAQSKRVTQRSCTKDTCWMDMTNVYAKVFGGANFLQNTTISGNKSEYDPGYVFAGSLGYCWRNGLHVEGEYAFRRNAISKIHFTSQGFSKDGHFQTSSYMANLLWYLPLCSWGYKSWHIRPLFGAGIGYDSQKMHASNSRVVFNEKWNHFAWQLMAGLAFPLSYRTELTLEYKFHQGGSHFFNTAVGLGLTYKFGLR
jgi:opacity protein-like surface antigen